jgi:hypothetical protein
MNSTEDSDADSTDGSTAGSSEANHPLDALAERVAPEGQKQ